MKLPWPITLLDWKALLSKGHEGGIKQVSLSYAVMFLIWQQSQMMRRSNLCFHRSSLATRTSSHCKPCVLSHKASAASAPVEGKDSLEHVCLHATLHSLTVKGIGFYPWGPLCDIIVGLRQGAFSPIDFQVGSGERVAIGLRPSQDDIFSAAVWHPSFQYFQAHFAGELATSQIGGPWRCSEHTRLDLSHL